MQQKMGRCVSQSGDQAVHQSSGPLRPVPSHPPSPVDSTPTHLAVNRRLLQRYQEC